MSTHQNRAVLIRWVDALNEANLDKIDQLADELYTDDYVLTVR